MLKIKKIFILIIFSISINIIYSSNCQIVSNNLILDSNINQNGSCFIINKSNLIFDCNNFQISGNGSGYGIEINNNKNITIKNCNITNFFNQISISNFSENINIINNSFYVNIGLYGVALINIEDTNNTNILNNIFISEDTRTYNLYTNNCNNFNISNNLLKAISIHSAGIYLKNSNNFQIKNNQIYLYSNSGDDTHGIDLIYSQNFKLINNSIHTNNRFPIDIDPGSNLENYNHNIDSSNMGNNKPIIYLNNYTNLIIENYTESIGQLFIVNSNNLTIRNIIKNNSDGILLKDVDNSRIYNLKIINSTSIGLRLENSNDNILKNISIVPSINYNTGISIVATNNYLENLYVNATGNTYPFYLTSGGNNIVNNSKFFGTKYGGYIGYTNNNKIYNSIFYSSEGIDLHSSDWTTHINYIINCTYDKNEFYFNGEGNNLFNFSQYVDIKIIDTSLNPIENVSINITNKFGIRIHSNLITNNKGKINRLILTEYLQDRTMDYSTGNVTFYGPYNITLTKNGIVQNFNLNLENSDSFSFDFTKYSNSLIPLTNKTKNNIFPLENFKSKIISLIIVLIFFFL